MTNLTKPSGTSDKPLESLTFFLDNDTSCEDIIAALRDCGAADVILLRHRFPTVSTSDIDWLELVGRNGWVFLSRDKKIRYRTYEREQLVRHGVRGFFIVSANMTGAEMGERIRIAAKKIAKIVASYEGPFIVHIQSGNTLEGKLGTCVDKRF